MATAGERYEERTGNIWSYAHRGDMSGLRAALARDVSPDMINTAGWTPSHAAAAGGHTKALRLLARNGANLEIADKGGNLPAHQAAKNGHVHALRVLKELGADITKVRLSQSKGKAVRDVLIEAYQKAGKSNSDEEAEDHAPVGYARKQAKSTAFWGPRRTPISTKIKKKIIKEKRQKRKEKNETAWNGIRCSDRQPVDDVSDGGGDTVETENVEPSYVETVRQIKRDKKQRQRQKQGRKQHNKQFVEETNGVIEEECSDCSTVSSSSNGKESNNQPSETNGFAALSILDESDYSSDE